MKYKIIFKSEYKRITSIPSQKLVCVCVCWGGGRGGVQHVRQELTI